MAKEKLETAKKCLLQGLDIDTIISITGLNKQDIENIQYK